eukprot:9810741-Heterocapsa_arctica.AAC.1
MSWSPGPLGRWSSHFLSCTSFQTAWFSGLRLPGFAPLIPRHVCLAIARMSVEPIAAFVAHGAEVRVVHVALYE